MPSWTVGKLLDAVRRLPWMHRIVTYGFLLGVGLGRVPTPIMAHFVSLLCPFIAALLIRF